MPEIGAVLAFFAALAYWERWRRKGLLAWYFAGLGSAWFLLALTFFLFAVGQLSILPFRFYARLSIYILATGTLVEHGSVLMAGAINRIKARFGG